MYIYKYVIAISHGTSHGMWHVVRNVALRATCDTSYAVTPYTACRKTSHVYVYTSTDVYTRP